MIKTLIVEDDYRVADIHAAFVSSIAGFNIVGKAHSCAEAYKLILEKKPDLVLLDLYLPDDHGLKLYLKLQQLPTENRVDVFIISAASDVNNIREALQLGAAQYIVKPFNQSQLAERLVAYKFARERLETTNHISQEDIDRLSLAMRGPRALRTNAEPLRNPTSTAILKFLQAKDGPVSANDVQEELGFGRATAQRYLAALLDEGELELILQYGTTGRPIHYYKISRK